MKRGVREMSGVWRYERRPGIGPRSAAVRLSPRTLDNEISLQALIEWYRQRGYKIDSSVLSEMEKLILKSSR